MSEFVGNLPSIFLSFRNLQRKTQLHEEEPTGSNQEAPIISPDVCPNTAEISETDTSPAKTITVIQGVRSILQIEGLDVVSSGTVEVAGRTSESDDGMRVSKDCAEKFDLPHGRVDVSKLVDLGGDSVADLLGKGG